MPMEFACKGCGYRTLIRQRACAVCGVRPMVSASDYDYWLAHKDDAPKAAAKTLKATQRVGTLDSFDDDDVKKMKIGWPQLDYFFGGEEGGIEEGAVFRLTGPAGCGKSTLLLQLAAATGALYLCAEERGGRVSKRARRLGLKGLERAHLVVGVSMQRARRVIREVKPKLIIVDSLQTFQDIPEEAEDSGDTAILFRSSENPDDVVKIAAEFIHIAQSQKASVILINHLNKEGQAAGKVKIDYLIDGNFEMFGEQSSHVRFLRSTKNRTGGTSMTAAFWMTKRGLIDVPKGDAAEALERLIAEGMMETPYEQLEKEANESERTFDQFVKETDGPREKPVRVRGRRGAAP